MPEEDTVGTDRPRQSRGFRPLEIVFWGTDDLRLGIVGFPSQESGPEQNKIA